MGRGLGGGREARNRAALFTVPPRIYNVLGELIAFGKLWGAPQFSVGGVAP